MVDETTPTVSVLRPRSDEGPIKLCSYVLNPRGETIPSSEHIPGIDIWHDLALDVLVFTVISCAEGSALRYDYIPGVGTFSGYGLLPQGQVTQDQRSAIDEILASYDLEIAINESLKEMMIRVLTKYVVF